MNYARQEPDRKAYVYSIVFHIALILLMLNTPVLFEVEAPQFYELNLGTLSTQRVEEILDEARRREATKTMQEEGMTPSQRVEVPKRKMLEIEPPSISVPAEERVLPHDIISNAERMTFEVESPSVELPVNNESIFSMDRKETFQGSKITIGEQPGSGIETGTIGADQGFDITIEGEVKGRDIVSNPLPAYPEGLNKNATIKIRFSVLADGTVSSSGMVPVRKENAVLEDLTMKTLKLWRFSALPEGDTRKQSGIITFTYKVK